jgi:hypothetical protein
VNTRFEDINQVFLIAFISHHRLRQHHRPEHLAL